MKPYAADRHRPAARLSAQPRLLEQPEVPYPAEARKAGVEGQVSCSSAIDRQGRVAAARVLSTGRRAGRGGPRRRAPVPLQPRAARRRAGRGPEIRFTYTFVLE